MSRVVAISGFPEWSPEGRVVERHVIDTLREVFELHGFAEIETRAVEPLDRLGGDSDASKEVYALRRLRATEGEGDPGLGLHFDLTVPFARYVEEKSGRLVFPFRRYQIQKVWRGERPQEGRFREFYQADIDIVGRDELPPRAEAEVAIVMARALTRLPIPSATMRVNDRRLVEALHRSLGVADVAVTLRILDKLPKLGGKAVWAELEAVGLGDDVAAAILDLAQVRGDEDEIGSAVESWAANHAIAIPDDARVALADVVALVGSVNAAIRPGAAIADLSIARGLDYYTGAVVETFISGHENLGSVCSGGRYDSLVAGGGYPGVGMSVGVSRIVARIVAAELAVATRGVATAVLVAVVDEEGRVASEGIADRLRARGIAAEVAPSAAKYGKQIQHAERRGIPFVWFPGEGGDEVKDIRSGDQIPADADEWSPPEADLRPRVERR